MVATPIYDSATQGTRYVRAALALALAAQAAWSSTVRPSSSTSRRSTVRATCWRHIFLNSDFTHLLFIDADIDFSADDVFSLIEADGGTRPDCAVLGGAGTHGG